MKFTVLLLLFSTALLQSQQDPQLSQFHNNRLLYNPAYAGMNGFLCIGTAYRTQWVGFPGAPRTFTGWINGRSNLLGGGIGLHFTHDQLGLEKNTRILGSYSKHFELFKGKLGIGIAGNIQQKTLNGIWMAPDGTQGDASIPSPSARDWIAGMDMGFWYHASHLYFGISGTQLTQSVFRDGPVSYKSVRHYFANAGFRYTPSFLRNIELINHLLVKSDGKALAFDLHSQAWFMEQFYLGAGIRPGDAVIASAGFRWLGLLFGYSYDITTSSLRNHSSNSHEISVRYCVPIVPHERKKKSAENPRFMWGERFSTPGYKDRFIPPSFNSDW